MVAVAQVVQFGYVDFRDTAGWAVGYVASLRYHVIQAGVGGGIEESAPCVAVASDVVVAALSAFLVAETGTVVNHVHDFFRCHLGYFVTQQW